METKLPRKKIAKAAIITAGLSLGAILGQSMFNEAQASGGQFGYDLYMCYKGYGCGLSVQVTCGLYAPCG